ncbi:MAG: alpha/beta fold hydrolase [Pseudomonadota bacterium]
MKSDFGFGRRPAARSGPCFATLLIGVLALALARAVEGAGAETPAKGTVLTTPVVVVSETGERQTAEQGLFFVPENRSADTSKTIAIHFMRFEAEQAVAARAPVFLLAGGPGSVYDFTEAEDFEIAKRLRRTRDVVYVGQRGNPREPGLTPSLYLEIDGAPLDRPTEFNAGVQRLRAALTTAQERWLAAGVDLAGYDIMNISSDLYELREALGYPKIALRGCSFGSQWSMTYMKRFPETVDRALLSGVEPLDFAYDSPAGLWAGMSRLAELSERDAQLASSIPEGGLMAALTTVVERLEQAPVSVPLPGPDGQELIVVVGVEDLRDALTYSFGDTRWERHENWPRFILEMHAGDFRYLAALALRARSNVRRTTLIGLLIDNSLGISRRRDAQLLAEAETRWLGDINAYYRETRDLTATTPVDESFLSDFRVDYPVLLVNGDIDWSTPLENAQHALGFLDRGHLVTVRGAGHCPLANELRDHRPEVMEQIYRFFEADFSEDDGFFDGLPDEVELPAYDFATLEGPSLYEQAVARFLSR